MYILVLELSILSTICRLHIGSECGIIIIYFLPLYHLPQKHGFLFQLCRYRILTREDAPKTLMRNPVSW